LEEEFFEEDEEDNKLPLLLLTPSFGGTGGCIYIEGAEGGRIMVGEFTGGITGTCGGIIKGLGEE